MARGRGRNHHKANTRIKQRQEESHLNKRHYEEFGELHPIDEKESKRKRFKVEDTEPDDDDDEAAIEESEVLSEDEGDDALHNLMATFNTHTMKAVDSDDDDGDDDDDEDDDGDDDEDNEDDERDEDDDDNDDDDNNDGNDSNDGDDDDDSIDDDDDDNDNEDDDDDIGNNKCTAKKYKKINEIDKKMSNKANKITEKTESKIAKCEASENSEKKKENGDSSDEESVAQSQTDMFTRHFEKNMNESCAEQLKNRTLWTSHFKNWSTLGRIKVTVPKVENQTSKPLLLSEEEEDDPPPIGAVPHPPPDKHNYNIQDYHIMKILCNNLANISDGDDVDPTSHLSDLQKEMLCVLSNYSDFYYPEASHRRWEEVRTVYALHALNHVLKTRKRIMNHNSKIKSRKHKKAAGPIIDSHRDQGYTRAKVLILLPFKHSAFMFVNKLVTLLFKGVTTYVQNYSRFKEDFGMDGEVKESQDDKLSRPEDFLATFTGDTNEDFKVGIKVTKSSLKLYADFYQSDIILASPLGLRYIMGSTSRTDLQRDFLASVEVLILDQADVFMMQNWEHIIVLMEAINKPPHDVHKLDTDLTRVRLWSLEGHAPLYRQTVIFSSTNLDHHRALINKCLNFAGKLEVLNPAKGGTVQEVVVRTDLIINSISGMRDSDARFKYFTAELLPRLRAEHQSHTLVYIPDYCDYVRILRYLKEDGGTSIASINEYMVGQNNKVAKIRSLFFEGKRDFLLYTERFHFYRRYRIKGVRHVIFYDLPTYPHFFSEICNLMVESNQNHRTRKQHRGSTVTMIVQKSNLTPLIGILGSQRTADILNSKKTIHKCVLGT